MGMYLIVPISKDSLLSDRVLNSRCPDWILLFSNVKVLPRDAGHPRLAPSHVVKTSMNLYCGVRTVGIDGGLAYVRLDSW